MCVHNKRKAKRTDGDRRKNNGNCAGKLQKAKVVIEIELKQSDDDVQKEADRAIKKKLCHIVREVKQISSCHARERQRKREGEKREV